MFNRLTTLAAKTSSPVPLVLIDIVSWNFENITCRINEYDLVNVLERPQKYPSYSLPSK